MGIIYCITFPNGKKYIGQTKQKLKKRLQQHNKQKYCRAVHNAIKKYKEYRCDIILEIDNDKLDYYEEKYIKEYNTLVPNGYNIKEGGATSSFCEETKKLMSLSHKGKKHSEETKKIISSSLIGRNLSEETKIKISQSKKNSELSEESKKRMNRTGMKHNDECKLKLSKCNKGKIVTKDTREKLSQSLRKNGDALPLYVHKKEENCKTYHGSGYVVRVPGFKSKSFISKKMSDEEKYNLALEYLNNITI
jgi:group I intron endonuclease